MPTIPGIGMGPIGYGHDFNLFSKVTVTNSTFNSTADIFIPFSTQGFILLNEDSANIVQVSFNGTTVHDELNPVIARGFTYDNRVVAKIWFKLETGASAVISVRAWAIR
jgi:hypothetical protein